MGKEQWIVKLYPGNKVRHNHLFIVYRDGHVKASRSPVVNREHITLCDLYATCFYNDID